MELCRKNKPDSFCRSRKNQLFWWKSNYGTLADQKLDTIIQSKRVELFDKKMWNHLKRLLGSRLKEKNLLEKDVKISLYRNQEKDLTTYFSSQDSLIYCNDVHGEKNRAHAAIKQSRGDSVLVALFRERWNIETDTRNIATSSMLYRY